MKKLFSLLLICFCILSFSACNKSSTNNTLESELLAPRPKLDANKDYTNNLSGHWSWVAKRVKDKKEIGKGQFILLQKGDQLIGLNKIEGGMETILPSNVQVKNVASTPLKGRYVENNPRIQFNIKGNGLNIDNMGQLSAKGHSFKGHGFSLLSSVGGGIDNGKFNEVEYIWEATRTTG